MFLWNCLLYFQMKETHPHSYHTAHIHIKMTNYIGPKREEETRVYILVHRSREEKEKTNTRTQDDIHNKGKDISNHNNKEYNHVISCKKRYNETKRRKDKKDLDKCGGQARNNDQIY